MLIYKHEDGTDIAFEILKKYKVRNKGIWKLRVGWWNIGRSHEPFRIYVESKLVLTEEQFRKWTPYSKLFHLKETPIADSKTIDSWRKQWLERNIK